MGQDDNRLDDSMEALGTPRGQGYIIEFLDILRRISEVSDISSDTKRACQHSWTRWSTLVPESLEATLKSVTFDDSHIKLLKNLGKKK